MYLTLLNRRLHYWITAFIAIPALIIICSGVLLQLKKHWNWIQPTEQRGSSTIPTLEFAQILEAVQSLDDFKTIGWHDIKRIDIRPKMGLAKIQLDPNWEIQLDLGSGQILQSTKRHSDLIEAIHDGSFFGGNWTKLGLWLPTAIALLIMWLTGLIMFCQTYIKKHNRS